MMDIETKFNITIDNCILYFLTRRDHTRLGCNLKCLNPIPTYYLIFYRLILGLYHTNSIAKLIHRIK